MKRVPWAEVLLAICVIVLIALPWFLGAQQGSEEERRSRYPKWLAVQAKDVAEVQCAKIKPEKMFDCVYEKVAAADETARSEQDLTAQQDAARGSLVAGFTGLLTMLVSALSLYLIWETLRATRATLQEAKRSTEAAVASAVEARNAGMLNFPIMVLQSISANRYEREEGSGHAPVTPVQLTIEFINLGRTMAFVERFWFEPFSTSDESTEPKLPPCGGHVVRKDRVVQPNGSYYPDPEWLSVNEIPNLSYVMDRRAQLFFWGYLDYSDFAGQWHRVGFKFGWSNMPPGPDNGNGEYVQVYRDHSGLVYRRPLSKNEI